MFDIPIVLFMFKREEKSVRIVERVAHVRPTRVYLISDGPRTPEETVRVTACRRAVEAAITWPCEIIKNYASENRGVYDRIGLGAKWVFEREKQAIFLEDDNLPEVGFFEFCRTLLGQYRCDTRVLWICGTNYLESFRPSDNSSYLFTRHMLPCGWASWSEKFLKFYDGEMTLWDSAYLRNRVLLEVDNKALARQLAKAWERTWRTLRSDRRSASWDHQMAFSMRVHGLYAISPSVNLIENIGVDADSTHGGVSTQNIMTRRFCSMRSLPIAFPLVHPLAALPDRDYERRVGKIILAPLRYRIKGMLVSTLKRLLGISQETRLKEAVSLRVREE